MGRTLIVVVLSASGLLNADTEEEGLSDPFALVSFDGKVEMEFGRTPTVENTLEPSWIIQWK